MTMKFKKLNSQVSFLNCSSVFINDITMKIDFILKIIKAILFLNFIEIKQQISELLWKITQTT